MEDQATKSNKRVLNQTDESAMEVECHNGIEGRSRARPLAQKRRKNTSEDIRKISVPSHRFTPLRNNWPKIENTVTEHLDLLIKCDYKNKSVLIKTYEGTKDIANLQKAADFVKAFVYGFDIEDALALVRLDELFVETFEIKDIKTLNGDHQSRAIGRLAGKAGRIKHTIENATKTRIVLADSRIHILGHFQNIQAARRAICNLVLGSPPSKVFGQLHNVANAVSKRM